MYLIGVLWETADFICTNPKCGKVLDGYGNYVTNLKKEVERLKAKYEPETPNAVLTRGAEDDTTERRPSTKRNPPDRQGDRNAFEQP